MSDSTGIQDQHSPEVLVAYGSKHGATAEIAQRIGEVLRADGLTVEVLPADQVEQPDRYPALVLGSAVYALRWRRDARRLLRRMKHAGNGRQVWLFSSGPLDSDEHDPGKIVAKGVRKAAERPGVHEHRIFAGRYPTEPSNFIERSMLAKVPSERRDFRDWTKIEGWAHSIAGELRAEGRRAA